MPETFTPVALTNNGGQPLNAAYFNRLETGIELLDDRAAALELGIYAPVDMPFTTSITLNATQGTLFRLDALGDFTLDNIVGGSNGQTVVFQVLAQGDTRIMSFTDALGSISIPAGALWMGTFTYYSSNDTWFLQSDGGGTGGVGTVTAADVVDFAEAAQDAVATALTSGSHSDIDFVYDDANSRINATVAIPTTVTHNTQTGTAYTLVLSDAGKVVERNSASANTTTIPPNSSVEFPVGTYLSVRQYGAGQSSIVAGAGVTINSYGGGLRLAGRFAEATLTKRAADEWVLTGETGV
jgi:hypothetical protein